MKDRVLQLFATAGQDPAAGLWGRAETIAAARSFAALPRRERVRPFRRAAPRFG